jgi:hypothetical protein
VLVKEVLQGAIIVILLEGRDVNPFIQYGVIMIKLDTKVAGVIWDPLQDDVMVLIRIIIRIIR